MGDIAFPAFSLAKVERKAPQMIAADIAEKINSQAFEKVVATGPYVNFFLDKNAKIRYSHENPDIKTLYENYFNTPNSHKAHQVLHTDHFAWEMPKCPTRDRDGYIIRERYL